MSNSLQGAFALDAATVDRVVTERSPSAYALGHKDPGRSFSIAYVGRADGSLNVRLKQQAGVSGYTAFMFQYCESARQAFDAECEVFHTFAPPDNKAHPLRPAGAGWKCPGCGIYG